MNKRLLLLPCVLLALAVALSACGGSSGGGGDEAQIEEVIETSATSTDPADCKKLSTQQFMEQTSSTEGAGAVKECEASASEEEGAESVEVSEVEVNGSEATAETTFTGGPLDQQAVEVALVKEGSDWKLNEIVGFTELDQGALAAAIGGKLTEEGGEVAALAPCIEAAFEEDEQSEVEELIIGGSSAPLEELAEECAAS